MRDVETHLARQGPRRIGRRHGLIARRIRSARTDSGQALVMAIIAVAVIALLVPIVGFNLQTETNEVNRASLSEDALAAAQAGINDYRTFIDSNPAYYAFTCGKPHGNLAMGTGAPTYACNTWEPVSGTNNEWFHYVPDDSQLARAAANSGSPHEMLLEVTGRAGAAGDYTYRTILAGYTLSGILTDSYYSNYELTDPGQPGAYPNATLTPKGKPAQTLTMDNIQVQYAELTTSGTYQYFGPESLLTALCVYHTYNENSFIDSLGTVTNQRVTSGGGHPIASSSEPYYGPFYDLLSSLPGGAQTINIPNTLPNSVVPVNAGAKIVINSGVMACADGGQGIYDSAVTFNGIAYTNDQLAFCNSGPTFTGSPPLESGAPSAEPRTTRSATSTSPRPPCRTLARWCRPPSSSRPDSASPPRPSRSGSAARWTATRGRKLPRSATRSPSAAWPCCRSRRCWASPACAATPGTSPATSRFRRRLRPSSMTWPADAVRRRSASGSVFPPTARTAAVIRCQGRVSGVCAC